MKYISLNHQVFRKLTHLLLLKGILLLVFTLLILLPSIIAQSNQFAIARYKENGSLDRSLDGYGKVVTNFRSSQNESGKGLAIDSRGRILVAGEAQINGYPQFAMARYKRNGKLDNSFGGDGKVLTNFSSTRGESASVIIIDRNDKILLAGYADRQFALARYNSDGSLDRTFDGDGKVLTNFSTASLEQIHSMVIDRLGRIVVAGVARVGRKNQFALARYNNNGRLDNRFDEDGKVLTDFPETDQETAYAIAIDQGYRIVVAGKAGTGNINGKQDRFALARYHEDGRLDHSFGRGGMVLTNFGSSEGVSAYAIALDGNNKIVLGGSAAFNRAGDSKQFALARYLTDGSLDRSFHYDGKVLTNFNSGSFEKIYAITVDDNSKIIAGGIAHVNGVNQFALARYYYNGNLDNSFDGDGKVLTRFLYATEVSLSGIAVDNRNKIVAAGMASLPCFKRILVKNEAAYMTSFKVEYTFEGRTYEQESDAFPVWQSKSLSIPCEARDVRVVGKVVLGTLIFWETFPEARDLCYKVTGISLTPDHESCN